VKAERRFRENESMITALVLMNVNRGMVNEIAQALLAIPGVAEVYSVTGEYDLVALLRLPRYEDLADVVTGRMIAVEGITRTETLMAFKAYSREDLEQAWDIGVE
jgi:DNA-binding Lrp family transcriptional regulator